MNIKTPVNPASSNAVSGGAVLRMLLAAFPQTSIASKPNDADRDSVCRLRVMPVSPATAMMIVRGRPCSRRARDGRVSMIIGARTTC